MAARTITSLRTKLTFFALLLVVFVASSLSYYIRVGEKRAIVESQRVNQLDSVKALAQVAREAILVDDETDMVNYVNLLKKSLTVSYAMVIDPTGMVRVHTDATKILSHLDDPATQKALQNRDRGESIVQEVKSENGKDLLDISIPIMIGNPAEYKGLARIAYDKTQMEQDLENDLKAVDLSIKRAFFIAVLIGLVGAFLLAAFITGPIDTLRKGAQMIGEGKLDHRIDVGTNDELRELADDFNMMAQKLGELDEMKRDFVSNVTHELRSPMTSIRGYIDLMLKGAAGSLSGEQTDYLSVVKNSAVRLGRFIDNLLDVAKIEAHKLKLTPEPLSIFSLAHEMEVLFKPQLGEKKISFTNAVPKNISDGFADKDKMAEVLINLTSNAIKFTPENGQLKMEAVEGPNYIEMSIHDNGAGIPQDAANKLFNKFEQVKSNQGLARQHKGTGLGLAITKGIIEAHGGRIWIKSPAPWGKGTAFYFTIPKMTPELKAKLAG